MATQRTSRLILILGILIIPFLFSSCVIDGCDCEDEIAATYGHFGEPEEVESDISNKKFELTLRYIALGFKKTFTWNDEDSEYCCLESTETITEDGSDDGDDSDDSDDSEDPDDPAKLTLQKDVTNDDDGTKEDTDFTLTATGPETVSGVEGDVAITDASVDAGDYVLSEEDVDDYTLTALACTNATSGGTDVSSVSTTNTTVTLAPNDDVTCTFTNDDD